MCYSPLRQENPTNVLIIGSGGRKHVLAWKAVQDPHVVKVFVTPGNTGTAIEVKCENVATDVLALEQLADFVAKSVQLTIVGPEAPLVAGVVDLSRERGLDTFGSTADAAQLEGSKTFTKDFLVRYRIPTAAYRSFTEVEPTLAYLREQGVPIVIRVDGLTAGKGVIVAMNLDEAEAVVRDMLAGNAFGDVGLHAVIEEFLDGEEASFIVMVDGQNMPPMATNQDHKRVDDGDSGPNTSDMGAYSSAPVVTTEIHQRVLDEVIYPTVRGMVEEGNVYTGFLYAGLVIGKSGAPKVTEFNCHLDDLETQSIMVRLEFFLVLLVEVVLAKALDKVEATWGPCPTVSMVPAADGYPSDYVKGEVIEGPAGAAALDGKVFHTDTALKDGRVVASGGCALRTTAISESVSTVQQQVYHLVEKIRWNGCFYRRDVGYRAITRERGGS